MRLYIATVLCFYFLCVLCEDTLPPTPTGIADTNETTTQQQSTLVSESTTAKSANNSCLQHDNCEDCSKHSECYFCQENNKCQTYVLKEVLPNKECQLKNVYYGTCTMSLLVVIILISIAVAIVLIFFIVCCCCCCCRRGSRFKLSKDDLKWARQREERRMRAEEKRKERASRTEEIRRKYGLFKDDTPYQKFEN